MPMLLEDVDVFLDEALLLADAVVLLQVVVPFADLAPLSRRVERHEMRAGAVLGDLLLQLEALRLLSEQPLLE